MDHIMRSTEPAYPEFVNLEGIIVAVQPISAESEVHCRTEMFGIISIDSGHVYRDAETIRFPNGDVTRNFKTYGYGARQPQVGDPIVCHQQPGSMTEIGMHSPLWPSYSYVGE